MKLRGTHKGEGWVVELYKHWPFSHRIHWIDSIWSAVFFSEMARGICVFLLFLLLTLPFAFASASGNNNIYSPLFSDGFICSYCELVLIYGDDYTCQSLMWITVKIILGTVEAWAVDFMGHVWYGGVVSATLCAKM